MYGLKKNGKVFTSKSVGTGPSSYEKSIYRAAVSRRLRNTVLNGLFPSSFPHQNPVFTSFKACYTPLPYLSDLITRMIFGYQYDVMGRIKALKPDCSCPNVSYTRRRSSTKFHSPIVCQHPSSLGLFLNDRCNLTHPCGLPTEL